MAEGRSEGRRSTEAWHALPGDRVLDRLKTSPAGLPAAEAEARLATHGPNRLEPPRPPSRWRILVRQFASPLIYILVGAAVVALALDEVADAGFIAAVLVLNALIGFANEARAERKVRALAGVARARARVKRGGEPVDVDAEGLVPGDVVVLESGMRVPADVRLLEARGLRVEEALLTGESVPVDKDPHPVARDTPLADRKSMAFAGTMVSSGRAVAVVVATAADTEVGAIAGQLGAVETRPPPLLVRMRRFAHVVETVALGVSAVIVAVGLLRGQPVEEVLLGAIALAVSAVPEGLPIALTVALAVAVSRMAGRNVVVRHLPAVEALGSCGVIATDKTGTLTRNELTVERVLVGPDAYRFTGVGYEPVGEVRLDAGVDEGPGDRGDDRVVSAADHPRLERLLRAGVLANEASLARREEEDGGWRWSGDPTDVALLSAARKAGLRPEELRSSVREVAALPFEPERRYAAVFVDDGGRGRVFVKGAPERVVDLCATEAGPGRGGAFDPGEVLRSARGLMKDGYRVLALADGELPALPAEDEPPSEPADLAFLGFVAMTDPPREGVEEAVARCHRAGVRVVMITGDHAVTASAIAERIGLKGEAEGVAGGDDGDSGREGDAELGDGAPEPRDVLEGRDVAAMSDEELVGAMKGRTVVARATPEDKIRVVRALQAAGEFVAVTGDGVNDAPALRQANLGVAMGRSGTDVAREAAELVVTDDDFSSIVAGIEEGRVAYDNVRKVTYLLVSTGAGEVLLVLLAVMLGMPVPFTAAQLLWLNLVTNGIQDVALAFEPGEPGVLDRPPRPPRERIFDRVMIERTLLAGATFAVVGWLLWQRLENHPLPEARNLMVQLFVLFEVMHIGNARSESLSLFRLSPFRNRVLLLGTLGALGVHLAALHTPFFQRILGIGPIHPADWFALVVMASAIVVVMEIHKRVRGPGRPPRAAS